MLFISRGITKEAESILGLPGVTADVAQLRGAASDHILELIQFTTMRAGRPNHQLVEPGQAHVAFRSGDFDELLQEARDLGALPIGEVTFFGHERAVYLRVSGGPVIELEEAVVR